MMGANGKPAHYDERLWRMIRGQVVSCIKAHPNYLTHDGKRSLADSIAKRVYGQVMSEDFERLRKEVAQAANDGAELISSASASVHQGASGSTTTVAAGRVGKARPAQISNGDGA